MEKLINDLHNLFYTFNPFIKLERPFEKRYVIFSQNCFYNYTITITPEHFGLVIDNRITNKVLFKHSFVHGEVDKLSKILSKHIVTAL